MPSAHHPSVGAVCVHPELQMHYFIFSEPIETNWLKNVLLVSSNGMQIMRREILIGRFQLINTLVVYRN
jgi:hypothetical protein